MLIRLPLKITQSELPPESVSWSEIIGKSLVAIAILIWLFFG